MVGIGFVGVGAMGQYQANAFLHGPDSKVVAGSDLAEKARAEFAKKHPGASIYSDHRDLLADENVDAVVIATPTGYHRDVAIDALKAGRHVLVEKPMARTVAQCHEMIAAAEKANKLLMVGHCRRFDNDWGTFARVYREGMLGDQLLWRHVMARPPPGRWFLDDQLSGGPLMDGAIHHQDFANLLFGEPECVIGSAIKLNPAVTAVDTATSIVRYRNGSQLLLSWSWAAAGSTLHDALGAKGTFIFGPKGLDVPESMGGHCLIDSRGNKQLLTFELKDMYVTQAAHFLDCVTGKARCFTPGTEAIKAVAVAETILKACRDGGVCKVAW